MLHQTPHREANGWSRTLNLLKHTIILFYEYFESRVCTKSQPQIKPISTVNSAHGKMKADGSDLLQKVIEPQVLHVHDYVFIRLSRVSLCDDCIFICVLVCNLAVDYITPLWFFN